MSWQQYFEMGNSAYCVSNLLGVSTGVRDVRLNAHEVWDIMEDNFEAVHVFGMQYLYEQDLEGKKFEIVNVCHPGRRAVVEEELHLWLLNYGDNHMDSLLPARIDFLVWDILRFLAIREVWLVKQDGVPTSSRELARRAINELKSLVCSYEEEMQCDYDMVI